MSNIREILEEKYDVNILNIEKIKNAYKITAKEGELCFKASHYDLMQFNFIVDVIEHLNASGFKGILPIYYTKYGEKYIKFERGYGFLCQWINARQVDFKNPVELKMSVNTLSSLHLNSRGFKSQNGVKGRVNYGKWIKKFEKRCNEMLCFKALITEKEYKTEFDSIYEKYFNQFYKKATGSIKHLKDSCYINLMKEQEKLLEVCHHDTANHNFLITPECNIYMIDFDYCIQDTHLHDLASIIIRNLKYGNWYMDTMDYIMNCYSETIPIDNRDRYIILCFMEFPQDFWQVGLQYYVEKQPWEEEFFLRKLNRIVKDRKDRDYFLDKLLEEVKWML